MPPEMNTQKENGKYAQDIIFVDFFRIKAGMNKFRQKFEWVMCITDSFSHFTTLYGQPNLNTVYTLRNLENYFCTFGPRINHYCLSSSFPTSFPTSCPILHFLPLQWRELFRFLPSLVATGPYPHLSPGPGSPPTSDDDPSSVQ